ncbi:MAG: sigma-70 family RNA polymerase sigma factor [Oscillospiraceae bacterium]|nr:sigma-70 family RNA polymerase sigma factor [Oscillospiraceae bacterium]
MKSLSERTERDSLAENNLGLVHLCANRFRGKGIEYDDLYGAGCVGLVKASKAFDKNRGVQFSTYAVPVIMGEIKRLFRDGGTLKVSRGLRELSLKISRERDKFQLRHGREPLISELAELLEVSAEDVAEAINVSRPVISLTRSSEDEDEGQNDIAVSPSPDEEMADRLSLMQVMDSLSAEDRRLIYLRYFRDMTQVNTAKELNMTQVQVSRREKKILTWMKGQFY